MKNRKAFVGATIINGDKNVPILENGTVLVGPDGNIEAVGTDIKLNPSVEIVNVSGKYIMPGLINAHVHLFSNGAVARKSGAGGSMIKFAYTVLRSFLGKLIMTPVYKNIAKVFVNAGVTTVRDCGSFYNLDIKTKKLVTSGKIDGPRIIPCGALIIATGGHSYAMPSSKQISGVPDAIRSARENIRDGAEWIKICTTGGVTDSKFIGGTECTHLTLEETKAIVSEAHRRNIMVASHCESTQGMRDCLEAGVDTIEHAATIEPDMIEHFINNPNSLRGYTAVIPTLLAGGALHEHTVEDTPANRVIMANSRHVSEGSNNAMKTAVKHGISVGIGTDSSVPYCTPYNTYMELVKMQQLTNLPALDVIDYATKGTAEILGIGDITGTLQVGKSADFIVLAKNPLDDLHNIKRPEQVVAMGKHYPNPHFKEYPGIE